MLTIGAFKWSSLQAAVNAVLASAKSCSTQLLHSTRQNDSWKLKNDKFDLNYTISDASQYNHVVIYNHDLKFCRLFSMIMIYENNVIVRETGLFLFSRL